MRRAGRKPAVQQHVHYFTDEKRRLEACATKIDWVSRARESPYKGEGATKGEFL